MGELPGKGCSMRLLAGSLVTTAAIFGSSQAFGQVQPGHGQTDQNPVAQQGQAIKGQPGQQTGQNPIGPTGQAIKGQPVGQNPIGPTGQAIKGQPAQQGGLSPIGQTGQQGGLSPFGQTGQNPIGQAGQNPIGQAGQNPGGQAGQSPGGQSGQEKPIQVGQAGLGTQDLIGTPLFQYADVRRSLNLTDEQINSLNTANDQFHQRLQDQTVRLKSLSETDRAVELQKQPTSQQDDFYRSANGVLTPEQMRRYRQLEYQIQGTGALLSPDVRKRLNLADGQILMLQDLHDQTPRNLRSAGQNRGETGSDAAARYNKYRQESNNRISAILNEDQRRAWREMTGEPFTFLFSIEPANNR